MPSSNVQSPLLIEHVSSPPDPYTLELSTAQRATLSDVFLDELEILDDEHVVTMENQAEWAQAVDGQATTDTRSGTLVITEEIAHRRVPVSESTHPEVTVDQERVATTAAQSSTETRPERAVSGIGNLGQLEEPQIADLDNEAMENNTSMNEDDPQPGSAGEDTTPESTDDVPAWVKYEEDTSIPDEEEMKEIEGSEYDKLSALDIPAMEEHFYTDIDDPEQRPVKKLRLSWIIRGVRGTKEKPNFARVMNSPGAYVDGLYWSIKFYPRGDNCSSLSAFVRCSREPPPVDEECPEHDFGFFEGLPDADLSSRSEPKVWMTVPAKTRPKKDVKPDEQDSSEHDETKKQSDTSDVETHGDHAMPGSVEDSDVSQERFTKSDASDLLNWRISAQLGMVIYNPVEPRTGHLQSDGHQFSKHCDDWGWVNFVGPWDEIHRRKRGQRQALLRNDTLAIDAYIRIYDDPTEALWWHESKDESQWPSMELAGYHSMGTPGLYHSPAVAGIAAWMLIAPLRDVIQAANGSLWRTDSNYSPKPLICQSQLVLDLMRNLSSDCYVNVYKIIEELMEVDERWNDVNSFWQVFRRGLELELSDEPDSLQKISSIFDVDGKPWEVPSLPVPGSPSIQEGLADLFNDIKFKGGLPDFMPIILNRSEFDKKIREWRLHNDRVRLNDYLDLSQWCTDQNSTYTLYGFIVHVGPRNSGKFYSILRPGGVGTKWLAFEDGNGNKVFSYSNKRIQEFEGLEGEELRKFPISQTRENAYLAIYLRTSCLSTYLPGKLEPYRVQKWLRPWADDLPNDDDDSLLHQEIAAQSPSEVQKQEEDGIQVELYLDEFIEGCENMLKLHDLRMSCIADGMCCTIRVATDRTFKEIRSAVAQAFGLDDSSKVQMWELYYHGQGRSARTSLGVISYRRKIVKEAVPGQNFRIWLSVLQPAGETTSHKHLIECLNDMDLGKKLVEDDTMEDVDAERLVAMTEAAGQSLLQSTEPTTELDGSAMSSVDAQQASIEAAVEHDMQNAFINQETADQEINTTVTPSTQDQSESSEGEEDVLTPTSSARSVSLGLEPHPNRAVNEPTSETAIVLDNENETARPVVHGHLVDATQHANPTSNIVVTHVSVNGPHGDTVTLAQILAEEAPEMEVVVHTDEGDEIRARQNERESQNRTPTQPYVARVYGWIQLFDVDQQKFTIQRPFHPELSMQIGAAVKEHMRYNDDQQFRLWKRSASGSLESLQSSTTFVQAGLQETFELVVGDVLSDAKIDELKSAGKFWQPQSLIAYIGMLQRKHPWATLTSIESIELADFGNDYYKGPLSRGRPHGKGGYLITSTGHTYEGPFIAGQKSGSNGLMTYQNGDTYVGEWFNDERHGQGESVEKRTGNRYVGGFENGKRWGQGVTYWQVADQQADMCQICYEEEIDALFYDCGHVCACVVCAKQCDTCPICRKGIRQVVKMFRA